jgi:3-hydroxybutyryl-CoA dehydrogenase
MTDESSFRRIAVVGGGVMGTGIAQVLALAGVDVAVHDPDADVRASLPQRLADLCKAYDLPRPEGTVSTHAVLSDAVGDAELVIEAGPERLDLKREIFALVEHLVPPETVLASNTSSIPIGELARDLADPARLLGLHFWNPPALVRLVEVISAPATDPAIAARVLAALLGIGMTAVAVLHDVPGFVGNRLQHALKREAIALVAAGVCSAETVDLVVREGFGARLGIVGPLEQSDLSGTDLTLAIHEVLMPSLDNTPVAHPYLVDMVARGDLGARTGQGFRNWAPGEAERRRAEIAAGLVRMARQRKARLGNEGAG